jgi:hypothetical protein
MPSGLALGAMPVLRIAGGLVGVACLTLVIVAGAFGSADPSRNPASYLVWLYFWPGVAILVLLLGDVWRWLSPWQALSTIVARERTHGTHGEKWALVAFAGFAWFDLASGLSNRPAAVALGALGLTALVLIPTLVIGQKWLKSAEPFGHVFAAIGQVSLVQIVRGSANRRDVALDWECSLLLAILMGAAIFDALIATPQWTSFVATITPAAVQRASPAFVAVRSAGLAGTVLLVACLFLVVASLVRFGSRASRTNAVATALLPIAVSLMVAHNLPALVHLGPRFPPVLIAFATGGATAFAESPDVAVPVSSASPLWIVEIAVIVLGLVWSSVIAWRLQTTNAVIDRIADSYPILALAALTSGLGLWILYLPVSATPV